MMDAATTHRGMYTDVQQAHRARGGGLGRLRNQRAREHLARSGSRAAGSCFQARLDAACRCGGTAQLESSDNSHDGAVRGSGRGTAFRSAKTPPGTSGRPLSERSVAEECLRVVECSSSCGYGGDSVPGPHLKPAGKIVRLKPHGALRREATALRTHTPLRPRLDSPDQPGLPPCRPSTARDRAGSSTARLRRPG